MTISKASIIAELKELGFNDIFTDPDEINKPFLYRDFSAKRQPHKVIAFYRVDTGGLWKYGADFGLGKFKVLVDKVWRDVDPMPIADLMVLYK